MQLLLLTFFAAASALGEFDGLKSYEYLNYPPISDESLYASSLCKKDIEETQLILPSFIAFERSFEIILFPVCETEDIDGMYIAIDESSGESSGETSGELLTEDVVIFLVQGFLKDKANSTVDGQLVNGVFQGAIIDETFSKYFVEVIHIEETRILNNAHSIMFAGRKSENKIEGSGEFGSGIAP